MINPRSTPGFMRAQAPYGMEHYDPTYASSHGASQRSIEQPQLLPPYQASSPYQQSTTLVRTSASSTNYLMATSEASPLPSSAPQHYSYPAVHGLPATPLGSNSTSYPPPSLYPPTSSSGYQSPYGPGQPTTLPVPGISSNQPQQASGVMLQCWEHGCNGRQFSTISNLIRHEREKSGEKPKSICSKCGAKFTRPPTRNEHMKKCQSGKHQVRTGRTGRRRMTMT
ncbi:hypothetical protein DM02DRAFT_578007 [Periconia macrospinosa]|uniref:C2H2-type domain-containing protein n=1 Tax=Periconia macrospinosa TaxID=97972 RepID=A0A2V1CXE3_9PLEO|nr:hypothetical protein DM02DRAFT_578007 [Periconia macrospinosa]